MKTITHENKELEISDELLEEIMKSQPKKD
jgi:hypothetical protein